MPQERPIVQRLGKTGRRHQGGPNNKLTEADVRAIRAAAAQGEPVSAIASRYPAVTYRTVYDVVQGYCWNWVR